MSLTAGRLALILAIALLAIATLGCGSDDKPADDTARQISDDELTGMALALTDFGADYADFVANGDNGPRTLDAIAEDDFDPEDERADLERAAWASGYQEFYISPQDAEEPSAFFVGSSIDLFETAEGAADYLDDSRTELTSQVGKSNNGFIFLGYREFDADVADEAAGAVFEGSIETEQISSTSLWMTAVMFRHARLVAVVGMYSSEEPQLEDTVKALALRFDQKIDSALAASAAAR